MNTLEAKDYKYSAAGETNLLCTAQSRESQSHSHNTDRENYGQNDGEKCSRVDTQTTLTHKYTYKHEKKTHMFTHNIDKMNH